MKAGSRKGTGKKKRRRLRRLYWIVSAILLISVVAAAILVANLKKIVLSQLRSSFPGLRISVARVSLESLSRIRVSGLRLAGERDEKGSLLILPEMLVRYRLHPFKGLVLKRIELQHPRATLRPGIGAVMSSLSGPSKATKTEAVFPPGPRIGRLSLSNSRIDFRMPDFRLICSLDAFADSTATGTLLDNTELSLESKNVLLSLPSFRLKDLDWKLSALIAREPAGKRIEVLRGDLSVADVLRSDFRGSLSFEKSNLVAKWQMDVAPFGLSNALNRLKEPFPELDRYRIEGLLAARLGSSYRPGNKPEFYFSGDVSLRDGRAVLPAPEPLIVEKLEVDLPFDCSLLGGDFALALGSKSHNLAGGAIAASRVSYSDEEIVSDLRAFFKAETDGTSKLVLNSLRALFRSHDGFFNARISGTVEDGQVDLESDVQVQEVGLDEVVQRLFGKKHFIWGRATGRARVALTTGPKADLKLEGVSSFRVPAAIVSLRNPLTITGLEIRAPFEYSASRNVHSFGIKRGESHPLGGVLTAEKIGYGEREAADGTTVPQWSVTGVWANAVSSGETTEVVIKSCRAYDGELTGTVTFSPDKKGLNFSGDLRLQDLDLERLVKGLGVKKEKFYVNGLLEGEITVSSQEGALGEIKAELSAVPPGGIMRVEDIGRLLDSIPGEAGKATLNALKTRLSPEEWESFVEAMKEFRYRVATVSATYRPLQARPGAGLRARLEIHLAGTGAGQKVDITIPVTWVVVE